MSHIPFFLVTGFLGSGKTTFLKRILNKYASEKKVAIIQNEFAPANIDGTDLKNDEKKFEILEINNGSVFYPSHLRNFLDNIAVLLIFKHNGFAFRHQEVVSTIRPLHGKRRCHAFRKACFYILDLPLY